MNQYLLIPVLLTTFILFTSFSGCTGSSDNYSDDMPDGVNQFKEVSKEESFRIAESYVKDLDSFREYGLTEPVPVESRALDCPYCWLFVFSFDLVSEKDPFVVDTASVELTVREGEIVDVVYVQGSRYKLGIPTGSMGVDALLEKPVYDTEIFV